MCFVGRDEPTEVSKTHAVNGNQTVPPFPEHMQMAMFGKTIFFNFII